MGRVLKAVPKTQTTALGSWNEADDRLLVVGRLKLQIDELETERAKRQKAIDEEISPRLKSLLEERQREENAILEFATAHRDEVKGQTWKGSFGSVKWSVPKPKVTILVAIEELIKRLRKAKLVDAIVTTESVDKNALKKIPEAKHEKLGFLIELGDSVPSIDVDTTKVVLHDTKERSAAR